MAGSRAEVSTVRARVRGGAGERLGDWEGVVVAVKRATKKRWRKALRREYVRERGRHDRCWDSVNYGIRAFRNAMRREMRVAELAFRRSMQAHLFGPPSLSPVEWQPTPRVLAKRRRA